MVRLEPLTTLDRARRTRDAAQDRYDDAKRVADGRGRHIADLVVDGREVRSEWVASYLEAREAQHAAKFELTRAESAVRDAMGGFLVSKSVAS